MIGKRKGTVHGGLNFVGNAYYRKSKSGKIKPCQFEFIPYILGKCSSGKGSVDRA